MPQPRHISSLSATLCARLYSIYMVKHESHVKCRDHCNKALYSPHIVDALHSLYTTCPQLTVILRQVKPYIHSTYIHRM